MIVYAHPVSSHIPAPEIFWILQPVSLYYFAKYIPLNYLTDPLSNGTKFWRIKEGGKRFFM